MLMLARVYMLLFDADGGAHNVQYVDVYGVGGASGGVDSDFGADVDVDG